MKRRLAMSLTETVLALFIMAVIIVGMMQMVLSLDHFSHRFGADEHALDQVEGLLLVPVSGEGEMEEGFRWRRSVEKLSAEEGLYIVELTLLRGEQSWTFETVVKESSHEAA